MYDELSVKRNFKLVNDLINKSNEEDFSGFSDKELLDFINNTKNLHQLDLAEQEYVNRHCAREGDYSFLGETYGQED